MHESRPHARPAPQFPGIDGVYAGTGLRPHIQRHGRDLGIGDGLQPAQHRGPGGKRANIEPTIGPYDYWAIEYAYRPRPKDTEGAELAKIAARCDRYVARLLVGRGRTCRRARPGREHDGSRNRSAAYAEAARSGARAVAANRIDATRSGRERIRSCVATFRADSSKRRQGDRIRDQIRRRPHDAARSRGTGRSPLVPVDVARQRAALQLVAREVLSADSFRFPPAFLRNMAVAPSDIDDAEVPGRSVPRSTSRSISRSLRCSACPGPADGRGRRPAAPQHRRESRRTESGAAARRALRDVASARSGAN